MCPCAPLVILAETHLQSLLCLGPCIYHDFGQYNAFAVQLMRCFRILADAILSIIFVQSAEIRWPDVIGHLYTSGLAMLSEILTEWVEFQTLHNNTLTVVDEQKFCDPSFCRPQHPNIMSSASTSVMMAQVY